MHINKNTITLTDDQATSFFGDDWINQVENTAGSTFFDGHEVYMEVIKNSPFDRLLLTAVYDDVDFESIYA